MTFKNAKKNQALHDLCKLSSNIWQLPLLKLNGKEGPENPYGFSKLMMDQIANRYSKDNPEYDNCRA